MKAQNAAQISSVTSDTPIEWPNSSGSRTLAQTNSSTTTRPTTRSGCVQPGNWMMLRAIGNRAAVGAPM
jgi:hypothetical protein